MSDLLSLRLWLQALLFDAVLSLNSRLIRAIDVLVLDILLLESRGGGVAREARHVGRLRCDESL